MAGESFLVSGACWDVRAIVTALDDWLTNALSPLDELVSYECLLYEPPYPWDEEEYALIDALDPGPIWVCLRSTLDLSTFDRWGAVKLWDEPVVFGLSCLESFFAKSRASFLTIDVAELVKLCWLLFEDDPPSEDWRNKEAPTLLVGVTTLWVKFAFCT